MISNVQSTGGSGAPLYQLKINLTDSKPSIWRRVVVRRDMRLDRLHKVIQVAMGWTNSHLHQFITPESIFYGEPDPDGFGTETLNEGVTPWPGGGGLWGIVLFTLTAIMFTVVITWVFNNTRGSLLIAILLHASIDTFSGTLASIFPPSAMASALPSLLGFGVLALLLVLITRSGLAYRGLEARENS